MNHSRKLDAYGGFPFDATNYSLKYARCQVVEQYSDAAAGEGNGNNYDDVLVKKRFAVLRLCPTNSCSSSKAFGCSSNYGEYMVELGTYLTAMQQYHEDLKEGYCNFCENYMASVEEAIANGNYQVNNANDDKVDDYIDDLGRRKKRALQGGEEGEDGEDNGPDEDGEDNGPDEDEDNGDNEPDEDGEDNEPDEDGEDNEPDEDGEDEDPEDGNNQGQQNNNDDGNNNYNQATIDYSSFEYYNECSSYQNTCANNNNDDATIVPEQYFECVQVQYNNQNLYIGPHCSSDSHGLELGIFYDEFCSNYAGSSYNIDTVSGISLSSADLSTYYAKDCISCEENSNPYSNVEYDQNDSNDITQICTDIYQNAAKCEDNMGGYSYGASQESQMTCTFLTNVMKGSYDESGRIYLNQKQYNAQHGRHIKPDTKVTGTQSFFLTFFILGTVGLLVYAGMLHQKIIRQTRSTKTGLIASNGDLA